MMMMETDELVVCNVQFVKGVILYSIFKWIGGEGGNWGKGMLRKIPL
jgi:hypothetical protein